MRIKIKNKPTADRFVFWELQRAWYLNGQGGYLVEISPDAVDSADLHPKTPIGYNPLYDVYTAFTADGQGILILNAEWMREEMERQAMQFGIHKTKVARQQPQLRWHEWFAWYPVRVGPDKAAWLERVERRRTKVGDGFSYRVKQ